jgi:hypothetical protein
MDGLWKYRFGCRNCGKVLYIETISDEQTNYNCSNCNSLNVVQKDQRWKDGKWYEMEINEINKFDEIVETPTTKPEALKKLKEAKEHLELELITQDDYDKLKNELSPIIMSSSDEESEINQLESTPTNQKTSQQSQQKPSESKKRSKWVYIGIVVFILLLIGVMMPPTSSSSGSSSSYSSSSHTCQWCGNSYRGRGFTTMMYVVNQVDRDDSPLNSYCSRSCAIKQIRSKGREPLKVN